MPIIFRCIARLRSTAVKALIHWLAEHVCMPEKLDRSTLADWVRRAAFELRPVFAALMAALKRSTKLFLPSRPIAAQSIGLTVKACIHPKAPAG
jgi:hypothetical protein